MKEMVLLIKPVSGACNMKCEYCFYADEQEKRETSSCGSMTQDTMHHIIDRALEYADRACTLMFQGGEPTLAGLAFYQDLIGYAEAKSEGKRMKFRYAIQTNGYALTEEWAAFFAKHKFLVGISLDGTKEMHDRFRKDKQGNGTWNRVMESVRLLEKYRADYNILTVVTAANARNGAKLYRFFQKQNFQYQQYIECLDPLYETWGNRQYSLTPEKYEYFLKSLFDAWYLDRKKGTYVYNRYFENLLLMISGQEPEACGMRGVCSRQWLIEADGSVYPCDFYALDEWRLGNINRDGFDAMEKKRESLGFIQASEAVPETCRKCQWFMLCRNGCRRNRMPAAAGRAGVNYFCSAYRNFFSYAYPRLEEILQMYYR